MSNPPPSDASRKEASLAARIAVVLDTTPQFWLNLQNAVDLHDAQAELAAWTPETLYILQPRGR